MAHNDHTAGITLVAPAGWRINRGDLADPLTSAVFPSADRDVMTQEDADAVEQWLWDEAPDAEPPERSEPVDVDLFNHVAIYVGRWDEFEKDPPDEEGLLADTVWLAGELDGLFCFLPRVIGHQVDQGRRKVTVSGRPAAEVWYRFTSFEHGRTTAYLRLLVIRLGVDSVSFVVGLAQSDLDRELVDGCLDTVRPADAVEQVIRVGGALVREAGVGDERALAELRWESQEEDARHDPRGERTFVRECTRWLKERLGGTWHAWVAEEADGTACGCVFLKVVDGVPSPRGGPAASGYVTDLYVTPRCRGRGIGGALLAQVRRAGRERRLDTLVAWPPEASAAPYRRGGFTEPARLLELPLG